MPAGFHRNAPPAELQLDLGIGGEEVRSHLDYNPLRDCDLQIFEEDGRQEFIYQHAAMLGIVGKLDDIVISVVGFQQMCLGTPSHFAHVPDSGQRH